MYWRPRHPHLTVAWKKGCFEPEEREQIQEKSFAVSFDVEKVVLLIGEDQHIFEMRK